MVHQVARLEPIRQLGHEAVDSVLHMAHYEPYGAQTLDSRCRPSIIHLVETYAVGRGISISTASRLLTGSGDTVDRMCRNGMSMTARRAAHVVQHASDHWPEDFEWPANIPRPAPKDKAA